MDEVRRFLDALWGAKEHDEYGRIEICHAAWKDGRVDGMRARYATTATVAALHVEEYRDKDEIYVCVSCGGDTGHAGRLSAHEARAACGVFADLDLERPGQSKGYPQTERDVRKILEACGLRPTILVDTGGGFQAWWLFQELWDVEDEVDREAFATLARRWVETLQVHARTVGGWRLDPCKDVVRLLRVPGTWNRKYGEPRPVRIVWDDGPRYDPLEDWEGRLVAEGAARSSGHVGTGNPRFDQLVGELDKLAAAGILELVATDQIEALADASPAFRAAWNRKSKHGDDLSSLDASVAVSAKICGLPDLITAQLVAATRKRYGDPKEKWRRTDYLARTVLFAAEKVTETQKQTDAVSFVMGEVARHEDAEMGRDEALAIARQLTGIEELVDIEQRGRGEHATYHLMLAGSGVVTIPSTRALMTPERFLEIAVSHRLGAPPPVKRAQWQVSMARILRVLSRFQDEPENDPIADTRAALADYLAGEGGLPCDEHDDHQWREAAKLRRPFRRRGMVWVHAPTFLEHLRRTGSKIEIQTLRKYLREISGNGPQSMVAKVLVDQLRTGERATCFKFNGYAIPWESIRDEVEPISSEDPDRYVSSGSL